MESMEVPSSDPINIQLNEPIINIDHVVPAVGGDIPAVGGDIPAVVGDVPPPIVANPVECHGNSTNRKKRTSKIWDMWEFIEVPDPNNADRKKELARCKICGESKDAKSKSGTSHFMRHTQSCSKKHKVDLKQPTISQTQYGALASFRYNQVRARDNMIKVIIMLELPFQFAEDKFLEFCICDSFHPSYTKFSRGTVRNRLVKFYSDEKEIVKKMLADCPGKISLTSDLWRSNQNLSYMALTAHFIGSDWVLHKRIIAYCLLDKTHTGDHIAQLVYEKVCEWEISHKVFCLSLDNASANTVSIGKLKCLLPNLPLRGELFHVRCCCHILNLVVQDGLRVQQFKDMLSKLKSNIEYIMVSEVRYAQYRALCISSGMPPRKLQLDVKHRWNSTYLMIKSVIPYRTVMTQFLFDRACPCLLTEEDWMYAELLCKILKPFYEATNFFSGVSYVSSNRVLEYLLDIGVVFKENRSDPLFSDIINAMEGKFVKYWGETPLLFGISCVLDPRVKMKVELVLEELEYAFETSAYSIKCCTSQTFLIDCKLQELFAEYTQSSISNTLTTNVADPVVEDASSGRGAFWRSIGRGRRDPFAAASEELSRYKSEPEPVVENVDKFNILGWWADNEKRFPILSAIARDVLSVPVSTVASESAFSCGKRILGDYRSCLTPDMLERCIILKDWWKDQYNGLLKIFDPLGDGFACDDSVVVPPGGATLNVDVGRVGLPTVDGGSGGAAPNVVVGPSN